ncbi:insulinase family protein [Clostridium paridis]|uniref:Insulinase family protein n=1 Tax=Clostridium paridis TaxID=2803863 RepID=A0A937K4M0_9CLOT|nr:insulinase family protein [Clostridium paridis]MBL4931365.1 insulinase family protein [Clostridium paridis]
MNYKEGNILSGFRLDSVTELKEINSIGLIFTHEKTQAKLIKLVNDDDNKVFAITFKTPPENSTGVPHIIEHSVLCGSEKFTSKEPFVELLKGSLNTFLNALTFSDKTMYPIASKNKKDFFNLMDVYLDAVLHPNLYKEKEIFMQEGWHYEIDETTDELKINGVVYNEMKGVYSSPDSIISREASTSLYPDTTYGVDSGGDPDVIPELTYDYFVNFHKKYYHPSNGVIFLYGDGDTEEELAFIHENYLKNYDFGPVDSEITIQEPFNEERKTKLSYGISEQEDESKKTYISLNYSIGDTLDKELGLSFEVLEYILLTANNAILKNRLIDSGVATVVSGRYERGIKQPYLNITIKNTDEENEREIISKIEEILKDICKNGISENFITGAINRKEFEIREANFGGYPKGLIYAIRILESMLYGGEAFLNLENTETIDDIRKKAANGYLEKLIEDYILNNTHKSIIVMTPEKGLTEKKENDLKAKLKKIKETLSSDELQRIKDEAEKLNKRQLTPDTKEQQDTIPKLAIEDIPKKVENIELKEVDIKGIKTLFTPMFTNEIAYVKLIFDGRTIEKEDAQYMALLSFLLGKINTKTKTYEELTNDINMSTGGISYSTRSFYKKGNMEDFTPVFTMAGKALSSKIGELVKLMKEVAIETSFEDTNRILQIVRDLRSRYQMAMVASGNVIGALRAIGYISKRGYFEDLIGGLGLYNFLCDMQKALEENPKEVKEKLESVSRKIFNINNLTISFTEEESKLSLLEENIDVLIDGLNKEGVYLKDYDYPLKKLNEGLLTQSNVNYVVLGGSYLNKGFSYSGSMRVLNTILNFDYLWNKVRVEGGAYGVRINLSKDGFIYFSSYRDPNIDKTFDAYKKTVEYLKSFNATDEDMVKYIIGTISKLDIPSNPDSKADKAVSDYFAGVTYEELNKEREEILKTSEKQIKDYYKVIGEAIRDNSITVVGNENQIKASKDIFDTIVNLF